MQMSAEMAWRIWRYVPGAALTALLWVSWAGGCLKALLHAQSCLRAAIQRGRLLCRTSCWQMSAGMAWTIRCHQTSNAVPALLLFDAFVRQAGQEALVALLQDLHRAQC